MILPKGNQDISALLARGYVSLNKFSKMIDVAYPTAKRMYERGEINGIRVGGIIRIYTEEVRRFLNEGNATDESAGDSGPQQPLS